MAIILKIEQLSKSFDGILAVGNVNISVEKGTITSIIGPNGAGKTTLFNLINGFVRQDSGKIIFKDNSIDNLSSSDRALLGIGRLWQDIRLFENMSVLDNLLVAPKHQQGESLWKNFLLTKVINSSEKNYYEQACKILEFVNLQDKINNFAQDLSYGQQKLLAIARLLMNESELLLLDEPLAGVNPKMIEKILDVIRNIASTGRTVLMIEHNVHKAKSISDKVLVMDEGKIEISGTPAEVFLNSQLREVYLGV